MENPYEPPQPITHEAAPARTADELASRWLRLGASLIDSLIGTLIWVPITFVLFGYNLQTLAAAGLSDKMLMALMGVGLFLLVHGYTLMRNGQTLGKVICRIRVCKLDGSIPPFASLILRRYLPIWLVVQIPIAGGIINLVNVLFVFRTDKRCLHDLIADTKVVKIS